MQKQEIRHHRILLTKGGIRYTVGCTKQGEIEPCSWKWPVSWGNHPGKKQVARFFKHRSYTFKDFDEEKIEFYKEKREIYTTKTVDSYDGIKGYGKCLMVCYKN